MATRRIKIPALGALVLGGLLLAGCASQPSQPTTLTTTPAAAKAAPTVATPPQPASKAAPKTWSEVFPDGQGKALALQACGTCHGFDRLVLGQKPADRWEAVKNSHKERASGMSEQDLNALFAYLATNFGPNNPEPNVAGLPVTGSSAE